jgi:hypothetical protein
MSSAPLPHPRPMTDRRLASLEALARSFPGRRLSAISAFDVERHKRPGSRPACASGQPRAGRPAGRLQPVPRGGKYEGDRAAHRLGGTHAAAGRHRLPHRRAHGPIRLRQVGSDPAVPMNARLRAALVLLKEQATGEATFARRDGSTLPLDPNRLLDGVPAGRAGRRSSWCSATRT